MSEEYTDEEDYQDCDGCTNTQIPLEDLITFEGGVYCDDCVSICHLCDKEFFINHAVDDGDAFCEECLAKR